MSIITNILSWFTKAFFTDNWVFQVFIVVFITLIAATVAKRVCARIIERLKKTRTVWDHTILWSVYKPLYALILVVGLAFAMEIIRLKEPGAVIFKAVPPLRSTAIIAIVVWAALRFISRCETNLIMHRPAGKEPLDVTLVRAVGKLLRITVVITGALVIMQTLGFSISGLVAFGGVGGIAIGFAAKDLLANFFGGLMIYLDRPFSIGDWVRSPDRELEGTVEYIGWRTTRIRTFDKRPLYVPNSIFATIAIENPSRMSNRRINTTIGLRYDDANKIAPLLEDVKKMLHEHPEIDTRQTLMVNLVNFGPSSLDFFIYTFTKTTDWVRFQAIQQDVFLKTIEIIQNHGAECAFPTQTLHIPNGLDMHEMALTSSAQIQARVPHEAPSNV